MTWARQGVYTSMGVGTGLVEVVRQLDHIPGGGSIALYHVVLLSIARLSFYGVPEVCSMEFHKNVLLNTFGPSGSCACSLEFHLAMGTSRLADLSVEFGGQVCLPHKPIHFPLYTAQAGQTSKVSTWCSACSAAT
jgi:hypothetical protein